MCPGIQAFFLFLIPTQTVFLQLLATKNDSGVWLDIQQKPSVAVSTLLNGQKRYASTICSLLTQCSESAL